MSHVNNFLLKKEFFSQSFNFSTFIRINLVKQFLVLGTSFIKFSICFFLMETNIPFVIQDLLISFRFLRDAFYEGCMFVDAIR